MELFAVVVHGVAQVSGCCVVVIVLLFCCSVVLLFRMQLSG